MYKSNDMMPWAVLRAGCFYCGGQLAAQYTGDPYFPFNYKHVRESGCDKPAIDPRVKHRIHKQLLGD